MSTPEERSLYNDIFISYSRKNGEFAKKLVSSMYERHQKKVWIDWEDIEYAEDWWEKIKAGIESADNFVFLLSPDSARSRVCYDEVDYAHSLGKRIIPILHQEITEENDFNSIHSTISQHNWLPFREQDDFEAGVAQLIATIEADLPHVRMHTRLLTRAREWDHSGRTDDRVMTAGELKEAQEWLDIADREKKDPPPGDLHREFVQTSREVHRRRQQRLYAGIVVATVIGLLAIVAFLLYQNAEANLLLANERGTEVAEQNAIARTNAADARFEANNAATQAQLALQNESTAVFAQGIAREEANNAATQAVVAKNNAATAVIAENEARMLAQTAEALRVTAEGDAIQRGETAVAALATSEQRGTQVQLEAQRAENNAATAVIAQDSAEQEAQRAATQAQRAERNAATAIVAQNNAETQAFRAERNAATATIAQGQALFEANRAATEAAFAATQAARATRAQGEAIQALATSEVSEIRARAQSLAVSADQVLSAGNPDLALALAIEAGNLNPSLTQTLRVLNQAAPLSVRLSVAGNNSTAAAPILERFADISPNGQYLAVVGERVQVWDLETLTLITDFDASQTTQALFSADSRYISVSNFDTITVWDVLNNAPVHQLTASGVFHSIAAHADDPEILVSYDGERVVRWNILRGDATLIAQPPADNFNVDWMRFSPLSGRLFLFDETDNRTASWNIETGTYLYQQYNADLRGVNEAMQYAWGNGYERGGFAQIWNLDRGSSVRVFNGVGYNFSTDSVRAATFSPDGRNLLVYTVRNNRTENRIDSLEIWDINNNRSVRTFRIPDNSWFITDMAYSRDGRYLLTGGNFGQIDTVILWDVQAGEEIRRYKGHLAAITHVKFSNDGQFALSRSADGDVRVWDVSTVNTAVEINPQEISVRPYLLQYAPDGNAIYGNQNSNIATIDPRTGRLDGVAQYSGGHTAMDFSPVDAYAALQVTDQVVIWDIEFGELGGVVSVMATDGRPIFSNDGQLIYVFIPPEISDNAEEADGCCRYTMQTWDVSNRLIPVLLGETVFDLPGDITGITNFWIDLHPDGRSLLITTSRDMDDPVSGRSHMIGHYDLISGNLIQQFEGVIGSLSAIRFSPDGTQVVAGVGTPQNALFLWDLQSGNRLRTFIGHEAPVDALAFSPDGRFLISGATNGVVKLWDAATGQLIRDYAIGLPTIDSLTFAPDGRTFSVSGGEQFAIFRVETLSDVVTWIYQNRFVPGLTCSQRAQYGVLPLCEAEIPAGTPIAALQASDTPVAALPTQPPRPTATPSPTQAMRNDSPRINSPLNVNLRSQPNPNAGILQSVSPETTIMILEDTPEKPFNAFWYPGYEYVELPDGTRGWLSKAVIYVPENRLQVRWRLQGDTEINVFQDNFRDGLLARLTSGSEIEILGYQASSYETGDFDMAQVRLPDGQIGWVERQNIAGG